MRADADDLPVVGPTADTLGVRSPGDPYEDIPVREGKVRPGTGGMSVAVHHPKNLHPARRPVPLGGRSLLPVFEIDSEDLPEGLVARQTSSTHAQIEPTWEMELDTYESLLEATRPRWRRIL
jgi:hypothetical protein